MKKELLSDAMKYCINEEMEHDYNSNNDGHYYLKCSFCDPDSDDDDEAFVQYISIYWITNGFNPYSYDMDVVVPKDKKWGITIEEEDDDACVYVSYRDDNNKEITDMYIFTKENMKEEVASIRRQFAFEEKIAFYNNKAVG